MPTPMTPGASERAPDTIVLVHGFWVTPRSWEHWMPHYEAKGYRVLAPAYPGFEVEVEARALYKRYHAPASGGLVWDSALANLTPGPQATWVNYRNAARPPLLFILGDEVHRMSR